MKMVWTSSAVGVENEDGSLYVTSARGPSAKDASCVTLEGLLSRMSVSVSGLFWTRNIEHTASATVFWSPWF